MRRVFVFLSVAAGLLACSESSDSSRPLDAGTEGGTFVDADALKDTANDAAESVADAGSESGPAVDAGPLTVLAPRGEVLVDGFDDDVAWSGAVAAVFDTTYAGVSTGKLTEMKFTWSDKGLALFASIEDTGLFVDQTKSITFERPQLYEEDCVELFFTPTAATPERYFEIELGPFGHFFDLEIDLQTNKADSAWSSNAQIATTRNATTRKATIEALFASNDIRSVLAAGSSYRIGLFRMEGQVSDPGGRLYLAWSPPKTAKPNFHVPSAFGTLVLLP